MKRKNGITLMALVITVAIMLILVTVTINFATNGGLFGKARKTAKDTQLEIDRDQLISAVVGSRKRDGYIDFTFLDSHLPTGFTKIGTNTYKSEKENVFTVDKYGKVTDGTGEGNEQTPPGITEEDWFNLEKYILGDNLEGRYLEEIWNKNTSQFTNSDLTFINSNAEDSTFLIFAYINNTLYGEGHVYFRYKNDGNIYRMRVATGAKDANGEDTRQGYTMPENGPYKLKVIPSNTNIGKTAMINGEKFIVLYDAKEQGENVQLISANTYMENSVYIGYADNMIDWTDSSVISAANIFNDTDAGESVLSDVEKAIYSYNHAIENLNNKASELAEGNTNSDLLDIRCVGSNPINKNKENNSMQDIEYTRDLPVNHSKYAPGLFNGKLKDGDTNYGEDVERMWLLQIQTAENGYDYWMASRFNDWAIANAGNPNETKEERYSIVHSPDTRSLILLLKRNDEIAKSANYGLRPVITIKANSLNKYLVNN